MKKFTFTLEKVLNLKNQFHEVKKTELAQLRLELIKVQDAIAEKQEEFKRQNEKMNELMRQGTTPENINTYKIYFVVLNEEEKRLRLEEADVNRRIAAKQQEIIDIKKEISGLEKLKEKQLDEYNAAAAKEQERQIEEFLSEKLSSAETALDIKPL